jgi:hypothetical protein
MLSGRGFGATPVDRGGRGVDDGLAAVLTGAFDRVDESLDVDAAAALWGSSSCIFREESAARWNTMSMPTDVYFT